MILPPTMSVFPALSNPVVPNRGANICSHFVEFLLGLSVQGHLILGNYALVIFIFIPFMIGLSVLGFSVLVH